MATSCKLAEAATVVPLPIIPMARFRRLMLYEGWAVDLARLCVDIPYAHECLALAHTSGDAALPTKRIATYLAALAFLGADGLEHSIRALAIIPTDISLVHSGIGHLLETSSIVMLIAVRAAAPLALAALVSNVTVALASRAAPALNAFSVMLAFFLLTGLGVLLATGPAFLDETRHVAELATRAAAEVFAR